MITACDLAARFGLKRTGRDWRGTCPACGYGGGAFVLSADSTGRPLAWCASCQDRDAIARAIGGDILARMAPGDIERAAAERARQRDKAIALWHCAVPAIGTLADAYLIRRGLAGLAASISAPVPGRHIASPGWTVSSVDRAGVRRPWPADCGASDVSSPGWT